MTGGGATSRGVGAACAAHATAPVMMAIRPADLIAIVSAFILAPAKLRVVAALLCKPYAMHESLIQQRF
jgi:hypothetical protein